LFTGVTTPWINPCHEFSVIASVVDTGDKFITAGNNPGEQLSLVTTTPAINLLTVTTTPVLRVCGVSMDTSFHGGSMKLSPAVSDFGARRYRRFGLK
jgi:hypothetical protein